MKERPIDHCYWVSDRFLAGEYPRAKTGCDVFGKLEALLDAGVTLFVDLTEEGELLSYGGELKSAEHRRFPIRDISIPRSTKQTAAILDAIDTHLSEGGVVYLHCWGGVGRTGTIVGCWLARRGYPGDAALDRLEQLWSHCPKSISRRSPETSEQRRYVGDWRE